MKTTFQNANNASDSANHSSREENELSNEKNRTGDDKYTCMLWEGELSSSEKNPK